MCQVEEVEEVSEVDSDFGDDSISEDDDFDVGLLVSRCNHFAGILLVNQIIVGPENPGQGINRPLLEII